MAGWLSDCTACLPRLPCHGCLAGQREPVQAHRAGRRHAGRHRRWGWAPPPGAAAPRCWRRGGVSHRQGTGVCCPSLPQHPTKPTAPLPSAGTWSQIVLDTLLGAVATQLVEPGAEIVSIYHRRLEHGYPTPSLGRDAVLKQALPWLRKSNIWSRGRCAALRCGLWGAQRRRWVGRSYGARSGRCGSYSCALSFIPPTRKLTVLLAAPMPHPCSAPAGLAATSTRLPTRTTH